MSLTAMNFLQSARRKFFMNSTYIISRMKDSNVFGLRKPKWSNCHELTRIVEKKIFHELDIHHV